MNLTLQDRAREIAAFLGKPYDECLARLQRGFAFNHAKVAEDWRAANPQTDEEILEWYRTTDSYIFELSCYHSDESGFNYRGLCAGVSEALRAKAGGMPIGEFTVLCLGDGIGDLSLRLNEDGFNALYHDLARSLTCKFAISRFKRYETRQITSDLTDGWEPHFLVNGEYDAIVSLDFLEHLPSGGVEKWVRAIFAALKPGGWLMAQNGFAIGSGEQGSIPCHLACNDRFEKDWDPLCAEVGFVQDSSNWYRRPL